MNGHRALMAVVFTDAVGYSTRAGLDEEQALNLLQADFDFMTQSCESHGGKVMKSMGDGLLMAFDSASAAVDASLEMQREFGHRGESFLQHRMGVHLCDVVMEDNDIKGEGVNLAARLEAEASPGSICLSQTIYEIVKSRLPVQAKFLGERYLKNLVEPVTLFEIAPDNAPKGQRIPPKVKKPPINLALPLALVFVGCCIVGAAAVIVGKTPAPASTKTYVVKEQQPPQIIRVPVVETKAPALVPPQSQLKPSVTQAKPQVLPQATAKISPSAPVAPDPAVTSIKEFKQVLRSFNDIRAPAHEPMISMLFWTG